MSNNDVRIRAVSFDVGGTLITPWPSVGDIYSDVARRHGHEVSAAALNQQFRAAWKKKHNFSHRREQWQALVNDTFGGLLASPPTDELFDELYGRFARAEAWKVFDDVFPALAALRSRDFKLAVLSNWDERLRPLLDELGLSRFFHSFAISIEVGEPKPARAIFESAAAQLGLPPNAVLHVGDTPGEDVEGALKAGFSALLLDRGAATQAHGAIVSLEALIELLEKPLHKPNSN